MLQQTQRRISLAIIGAVAGLAMLTTLFYLIAADWPGVIGSALGFVINTALFVAYRRGWEPARYLAVVLLVILVGFALHNPSNTARGIHPLIFVPPAAALVLARAPWVAGAGAFTYSLVLARLGLASPYAGPEFLVSTLVVLTVLVVSRVALDQAIRSSEQYARAAGEEAERAAAALAVVQRQADDLSARNEEQRMLLELVASLETPAVPVAADTLFVPIVGHLDARRAEKLTGHLLTTISAQRVRGLILDVSGLSALDRGVAGDLERLIAAVGLLGCSVTLTGIAPAVAVTLSELGVSFAGVVVARTPEDAIGRLAVAAHN